MLAGEEYPLSPEELQILFEIPSDRWSEVDDVRGDPHVLLRFAQQGILICDDPREPLATFRRRHEALSSTDWNLYAALYHAMRKWQDLDLGGSQRAARQAINRYVEVHGALPPSFHSPTWTEAVYPLPRREKDGELYRALLARRTVRTLDGEATLTADQFGTILRYVFGCHGYAPIHGGTWILKKTSPSGGSLHPVEAYPLIRRVGGIEPGLYHYNPERHELERLRSMSEEEASRLASVFCAGQPYAQEAAVLIALTARFSRSFWKYPNHEKAYSVILMDAGHLSQTFYLVCTNLELGPFVTAAINDRNIEEALGLDGFSEGVIAVLGAGQPGEGKAGLDPIFQPWEPP
jgi:putative peptide maturation dehydrogenase